jgi:hypothetical protein
MRAGGTEPRGVQTWPRRPIPRVAWVMRRMATSSRSSSTTPPSVAAIATIRERVMQTEDAREGIQSFVERRAAVFKGR